MKNYDVVGKNDRLV